MSTVRKEIQSLSVADRLQLLEEIWDSLLETPETVPVTDAQRKELERRRRACARAKSIRGQVVGADTCRAPTS
jgi:putative addiction module component (TIGR02574 family)